MDVKDSLYVVLKVHHNRWNERSDTGKGYRFLYIKKVQKRI